MLTCRDKGEVKVRTDINVKEIVKAMSPNTPAPPASAWDEGLTITMECQVTYSFLLQYRHGKFNLLSLCPLLERMTLYVIL